MGACALILLILPATAQSQSNADLGAQLTHHLSTMKRATAAKRVLVQHAKHRAQVRRLAVVRASTPQNVICRVFGDHCHEALAVSRCESGWRTDAQNGQYLGLFQMGSNERAIYGHGPSAVEQAVAAHRYFVASGSDWGPWSCKPW